MSSALCFQARPRNCLILDLYGFFFRNCTAVLIVLFALHNAGFWSITPDFLNSISMKMHVFLSERLFSPVMSFVFLIGFLALLCLLYFADYFLTTKCTEKGLMNDPESLFFKVTPLLRIADDIIESAAYIYFFMYLITVFASDSESITRFSIMLIAIPTFYDILSFNYQIHRESLTKSFIPSKKDDDTGNTNGTKKWRVK